MMQRLFVRALLLASAACVPLIIADAIDAGPATFGNRIAGLHWLFHFGTMVLTTLGAWIGFRSLGGQGPSLLVAATLGVLFGLVSIVGAPAALIFGDEKTVAGWLFLGGMFVTVGASPFIEPTDAAGR